MRRRALNTTFKAVGGWDNPNFSFAPNGVTIIYQSDTPTVGETGTYLPTGVTYTVVDNTTITTWGGDYATVVTSLVTDLGNLFRNNTTFNDDISSWDTSRVTFMRNMFRDASTFNRNISQWDTSLVNDMNNMFRGTIFNQDLGGWCVELIPSEPIGFSAGNIVWVLPKPNWGAPCV